MKPLWIGLAVAAATFAFVGGANAGTVTATLTGGDYTPFDEYPVSTQSGTTWTENGATSFKTTGNSFVTNTTLSGEYLKPLNDGPDGALSNYIFATSGSTNVPGVSDVDIGYKHDVYSFKILWGSPDTYNLITLSNGDTLSGATILSKLTTSSGDNAGTRWWLIQDTQPFSSWVASSSGVAFEYDLNVPESSTWAMMGLGFAGLGYVAFRRARKSAPVLA